MSRSLLIAMLSLSAMLAPLNWRFVAAERIASAAPEDLTVAASFSERRPVTPEESIELRLNRPLAPPEKRIAVFLDQTDLSSLFSPDHLSLRYSPQLWPLPLGEGVVTVYLVSEPDNWKEIARFKLRVIKTRSPETTGSQDRAESKSEFVKAGFQLPDPGPEFLTSPTQNSSAANDPKPADANKNHKLKFIPSLNLTVKSQPAQSTFPVPEGSQQRATFVDLTMQASLRNEATYGFLNSQSSFDFAGSTFQQEALRFGTLGEQAPRVDLASYLVQFQTGKVKYQIGSFTYGAQRQLINSFSSRGVMVTVPFLKHFDFSAAAMNGTQLVGYDNFFGLSKRKHQMFSGTLGVEFMPKRPGGLRLEVALLNAYFQPLAGFNRGVITDTQRSRGLSLRLLASDKSGRFHLDSGFTRSFFVTANDPTLSQGSSLVVVPNLTRNAHYLEVSYEVLRNVSLTKHKRLNLNLAFKEENVAPLFRSLGASTQADKIQYEFNATGSLNEIFAQFGHSNFHDNLRNIPSILRTLNSGTRFSIAAPASAFLNLKKNRTWLPRLSYSFDRFHAFAAAIPVNGGFEIDPSSVPDLIGTNNNFSADWQIKKFTFGYSLNRSFQNNQQTGREQADRGVLVNTGRVGMALSSRLALNLDLSSESSANKETGRVDRTARVGPGINWQLSKSMGLSASLANTIAGDAGKTSHSRNTEFDCAWTYRFTRGTENMKKVSGQFFIRYANHYSHLFDSVFLTNSLRKNQTLTANFSFTFF
ncbi:MAG TPA: hypothetical protein VKB46_01810 [Pyrinomonadaceae bacterium]|nr:hypothetical protein [Pyrinomonadaceae bacterium]